MMKGLKQLYYEKRLRELFILHKRRLTGESVPSANARGNKQKLEHREVCSEHLEALLYCVNDLCTGTGCSERKQSLFLGDFLKPPGDGTGCSALSGFVSAGVLDQMDTEGLSNLSHSIIFCWTSRNVFKGTRSWHQLWDSRFLYLMCEKLLWLSHSVMKASGLKVINNTCNLFIF